MDNLTTLQWPLWRKILFRFFFIYLTLQMAPWTWLDQVPGFGYLLQYYYKLMDWAVETGNRLWFHIRPVLVPVNGSGDTSYGWAQLCLFISMAVVGCIIWSALDRRRPNYTRLNYWLCLFARYYVALFAFVYGILKLFAMQMYFPNLHQLATPLGDILPMRLSWLFIGYSGPYQVFSGAMETLAGLLLLFRRTATMGVMIATAVFINVMMLNLCYDIPVKIFSIQLVITCLFLLANEAKRILCFFVLDKPAGTCSIYQHEYKQKWLRITRFVFKTVFIIIAVGMQLFSNYNYYRSAHQPPKNLPVKNGVYEVQVYKVNNKIIPSSLADTTRWHDVIFEDGLGSVKSSDTTFRQRYKRGYFYYQANDTTRSLSFKKMQDDQWPIFTFRYAMPDSNTLILSGMQRKDSLYVELKRIPRQFALATRQFHWLSEHNR